MLNEAFFTPLVILIAGIAGFIPIQIPKYALCADFGPHFPTYEFQF
jgi:hypothetical protein